MGAQRADLGDGWASATVTMRGPGVAVLSASYDPGWTATVKRAPRVRPDGGAGARRRRRAGGTDEVVLRFRGYGD